MSCRVTVRGKELHFEVILAGEQANELIKQLLVEK